MQKIVTSIQIQKTIITPGKLKTGDLGNDGELQISLRSLKNAHHQVGRQLVYNVAKLPKVGLFVGNKTAPLIWVCKACANFGVSGDRRPVPGM